MSSNTTATESTYTPRPSMSSNLPPYTPASSFYAASNSSKKSLIQIFHRRKASEESTTSEEPKKQKKTKQHVNREPFWAATATYMSMR